MRAVLALVERTGAAPDLDAFRTALVGGIRAVVPGAAIAYHETDLALGESRIWADPARSRVLLGARNDIVVQFSPMRSVRATLALSRPGPFSEAERDLLALLAPHLANGYRAARRATPAAAAAQLTAREREILRLVAAGRSDRQIAQHLGIATGTVRKHLERVRAKLGVPTRAAAVAAVAA